MSAAFFVAAFAISAKVFYYLFTEEFAGSGPERQASTQTAGSNALYLMLWAGLYGWVAVRIMGQLLAASLHPVAIRAVPAIALALGSVAWSVSPSRTLLHGTMFAFNVAVAYLISQSLSPREFLRLLRRTLVVLMLISLLLMALIPDLAATLRHDGAWLSDREMRGVFPFKTDAGWLFGLLLLLVIWTRDWTGNGSVRLAMAAVTLFAILLSNSATGIACALAVMAILLAVGMWPDHAASIFLGAFSAIVVFSLLLPFIDIGWFAGLLGRDPELTGRVPIWNAATKFILQRPLLGHGFGGFFDPIPQSPVWEFWAISPDSQAAHFHSSAVELLVALGGVGLAVYIGLLWLAFTVIYNRSIARPERIALAGMLLFFLIGAAADTTFMAYNSYVTMFLFYCVFAAGTAYPADGDPVAGV